MNVQASSVASGESSGDRGFVNRLSALSDLDFQQRLAEVFEREGYSVDRNTGNSQVDLMLQIADQVWLVQTRNWRCPMIDVDAITEMITMVSRNEVTGGLVVTAGSFAEAARLKVRGSGVRLINGVELSGMLRETRSTIDACPRCGSTLIERLAEGAKRRFRGCSTYPACHYTEGAAA